MSSVPRFFVTPADIVGDSVLLPADAAHHARNVLRLRPGEAVLLHDGAGLGVRAELTELTPKAVRAAVTERFAVRTEPRVRVTVAQALPKTGEKVEQVLQHGTEVGAAGFLLFPAQRSVARLDARDKAERRVERWRGIVRGAAEQSGRGLLPEVAWLPGADALASRLAAFDAVLVLHEAASVPLREALAAPEARDAASLCVVVGPEGGLAEGEVARFAEAGAAIVSLGPRVLRTETAALVALAQILYARDADAPADADTAAV
ncbi:MAG TPA: RsmE family RNA methyltransferase [Armatimonadaceae bacterium]|nr:RsmE family RNA methyltransferase [Armatimonadaceae bacterium]